MFFLFFINISWFVSDNSRFSNENSILIRISRYFNFRICVRTINSRTKSKRYESIRPESVSRFTEFFVQLLKIPNLGTIKWFVQPVTSKPQT